MKRTADLDPAVRKELTRIPGVGKETARDFADLGVTRVSQLAKADPLELYERLCDIRGVRIDRCQLYVFRCAVYFATAEEHEPELLKWWNWKDRESEYESRAG